MAEHEPHSKTTKIFLSILIALWMAFFFLFSIDFPGNMGLFVGILAFVVMSLVMTLHEAGRVSRGYTYALVLSAMLLSVAAPPLYQSIERQYERKYVIPTPEYSTDAEGWSLRAREQLERMGSEPDVPGSYQAVERRDLERASLTFLREPPAVELDEPPELRIDRDHPRLDGATALAGVYRSFVQATYRGNFDFNDTVKCSRTPFAYENLINGEADMIFVARPSDKQIEAAAAKGLEFSITPIGYEAFVFFVNPLNPVRGVSTQQLRDMYSGRTTNWRDVGGDNADIVLFQRSEGSGSQSRMQRFMRGDALLPPKTETLFNTMRAIVHTARYRNYKYAIGYSFYYFVDVMLAEKRVRLLEVDGVPPNPDTIRDRSYPLTEEICVVTAGGRNPHIAALVRWIVSPQGQRLVEKAGYTPAWPTSEK